MEQATTGTATQIAKGSSQRAMEVMKSPRTWMIIAIVIILSAVGYWVYQQYVAPRLSPSYVANKEYVQKDELSDENPDEAVVYLFYTTWCPACKKARPIWDSVREEYDGEMIHGTTKLVFKEVDCDKEEELADKFGIEGYPTIKMAYKNNVIEYDAKPERETLVEFIQSVTQ